MTDTAATPDVFDGPSLEERDARLAERADRLALRSTSRALLGNDKFMLAVSATLMTVGLTVILLGWVGAANATIIEKQVPYIVSGGLFGLALAVIGGLTLFSHWLTVLIRESREHEAARREDELVRRQDEAARRQDHQELIRVLREIGGFGPAGEGG